MQYQSVKLSASARQAVGYARLMFDVSQGEFASWIIISHMLARFPYTSQAFAAKLAPEAATIARAGRISVADMFDTSPTGETMPIPKEHRARLDELAAIAREDTIAAFLRACGRDLSDSTRAEIVRLYAEAAERRDGGG